MSDTSPVQFTDLSLPEPILKALNDLGYETPSPIQAECIPLLQDGGDVLGMAQTGTGKTAAFALPLLSRIDTSLTKPQILVLAPTRELAIQVAEAFQAYSRHMRGFHVLPIYGGQSYPIQLKALKRNPQVIVGTPGRVIDHINRGTLDLSGIKALVLDEADEMLRMGFIDDVESILSKTPEKRQMALFSATMPEEIRRITKRFMTEPTSVKIATKTSTVENIEQKCLIIGGLQAKLDGLTRILETEDYDGVIIFARTKTMTVELAEKLEARGYSAAALNGDLNQAMRERTVSRLKSGQLDIVIATDVAARGLDVPRIDLVINYDIPTDTESYVHRIGRTGRAGRKGTAILFAAPRERRLLKAIERATRQPLTMMDLPSRDDVTKKRIASFRDQLSTLSSGEENLDFYKNLVGQLSEELELSELDLASALLFMAQKEKPLVLPPEAPRRERSFRDDDRGDRGRDRNDRGERRDRGDRPERAERGERRPAAEMEVFRIEVGRTDGVQVKNIVGAIANEANINSRNIGGIRLHDDYSTIELPKGMPSEQLQQLQQVYVCNKALRMSKLEGVAAEGRQERSRPARDNDRPARDGHRGQRRDSNGGERRENSERRPRRPRRD
ncbi:Helicase [Moritella viscosa]|uniref:DEAD/DEAH box helicase n=1 Tax=Moritella viscosa TaxID=80854 RepID=UPI000508FD5A|nr:DEAD/DEAH box helicase [Moritella viscosa]CED61701.1 cold-shock DEAD box protein A [Moritella viscosa]SHO05618.1 Helicase [Moritella viscosa]SHO05628.1 Helicase [Moritella viscosa]SHO06479.1 Helicase [Moritella viscosa]SHO08928.1 Helicase [Moritella viscosa]